MQIKNHIAVVTGGGSGLGAATARKLAELGAKVVVLDVNKEHAQEVAKEIKGLAIACDVSDAKSAELAFAEIKKAYSDSEIRVCVNCAGIAPAKRTVGREGPMALDEFKKVIDINLIGTFNILRLAAFAMASTEACGQDGERGVIINTASVAAYEGQIGQAAYSASKGGVVSMTLPIARELSQSGIRVVTIAPGIMETPMLQGMPQAVQDSLGAMVPFPKRLGKATEYAELVTHIIHNTLLNGCVIRLDGAIRMQPK